MRRVEAGVCVRAGVGHPLVLLPVTPPLGFSMSVMEKSLQETCLCVYLTLFGAWDPQLVWTVGGRVF